MRYLSLFSGIEAAAGFIQGVHMKPIVIDLFCGAVCPKVAEALVGGMW